MPQYFESLKNIVVSPRLFWSTTPADRSIRGKVVDSIEQDIGDVFTFLQQVLIKTKQLFPGRRISVSL